MRIVLLLGLALVLAACATPRQRCLAASGNDLRVVDRLIAETEANLARGYAIVEEPYLASTGTICVGSSLSRRSTSVGLTLGTGATVCNGVETRTRSRAVALDTQAERRKLDDLRATRARLSAEADARAAACPPA